MGRERDTFCFRDRKESLGSGEFAHRSDHIIYLVSELPHWCHNNSLHLRELEGKREWGADEMCLRALLAGVDAAEHPQHKCCGLAGSRLSLCDQVRWPVELGLKLLDTGGDCWTNIRIAKNDGHTDFLNLGWMIESHAKYALKKLWLPTTIVGKIHDE